MAKNFGLSDERVAAYAESVFTTPDTVIDEIRARSIAAGLPQIHVSDFDGLHLEVLARACGAKKCVEIGTLAGLSGVFLCRAMGPEGKLYTFEYSPLHASVAEESFFNAGVRDQVELSIGPAIVNLPAIETEGLFDLVFIDADKPSYPAYFRWASENLRQGGLLIADNTFAWGRVATGGADDVEAEAIRSFNDLAANSGLFRATVFPTGEGLTVGVKL